MLGVGCKEEREEEEEETEETEEAEGEGREEDVEICESTNNTKRQQTNKQPSSQTKGRGERDTHHIVPRL